MNFKELNSLIKKQFNLMSSTGRLFISSVSGEKLWDLYIDYFNPGDDSVFRDPNSTSHTCFNDKNFIVRYGNVVSLDDDCNIITMFDIDVEDSIYESSSKAMSSALKEATIKSVFYIHYNDLMEYPYEKTKKTQGLYQLGCQKTDKVYSEHEASKFGVVNPNQIYTFHHFYVYLPRKYVLFNYSATEIKADESLKSNNAISLATFYSDVNTSHEIFVKGLSIPLETLDVIRQLFVQGSLLKAEVFQYKVEGFIKLIQEYNEVTSNKLNWTWKRFQDIPYARFANELIGTTCIELAEGKNINDVCGTFNFRADSVNFMKAKAPITQSQIDGANKRIVELGYEESFDRRFAVHNDIDPNMIFHTSAGTTKVKSGSLFSKVKPTASPMSRHKRAEFDKIDEISIEVFMKDILPTAKSLHVLLEPSFEHNLVTMTTANDPDCKSLFKWSNPFSWSYNGNLAAKSNLTQQVVNKGGRIDGVFRFSHSWNELEPNDSLMDLHVFLPTHAYPKTSNPGGSNYHDEYGNKERVGWNNRNHAATGGSQDVDYTEVAPAGYVPVENVTFHSLAKLPDGDYKCKIHNWNRRSTSGRGRAEVAFNGQVYQYIYPSTKQKEWVDIATVTLKKGVWIDIVHHIEPSVDDSNLWGLDTGKFHKVNLMCLSPNYWGDNAIGHKQYLFMLDGCHSNTPMRSFHIENLNAELLQDRKVLEVLGMTNMLEPTEKQLAGLGFTNDSKETVVVKVEGSFSRAVRIKF